MLFNAILKQISILCYKDSIDGTFCYFFFFADLTQLYFNPRLANYDIYKCCLIYLLIKKDLFLLKASFDDDYDIFGY